MGFSWAERALGQIMENLPKSQTRKRIEDVRIPAVKGISDDLYHLIHHSVVGIVRMRRSIESADAAISSSKIAIAGSKALLGRLETRFGSERGALSTEGVRRQLSLHSACGLGSARDQSRQGANDADHRRGLVDDGNGGPR